MGSGEELAYQWFGPGGVRLVDTPGEITGATTATLQILNVQLEDFGGYRVRVFNGESFVDSDVAILFQGRLFSVHLIILSCTIITLHESTKGTIVLFDCIVHC